MPLFALLKDEEKFESMLVKMGISPGSDLHLEFTVEAPKGKGKASHTDLMVRSHTEALALEAKWKEPRYDTVEEWMMKGDNPTNRLRVLTGWLALIQKHATRELRSDDFSKAVYQMLHRAASACYETERSHLAYLHFIVDPGDKGSNSEHYETDLVYLKSLLGNPRTFSFHLIEADLIPTAAFELIRNLRKASAETACEVITALEDDVPLFEFRDFRVKDI